MNFWAIVSIGIIAGSLGCSTPPQPLTVQKPYPHLIGHDQGDGYTYSLWQREDGSRYILNENNGQKMEKSP